MQRPDSIIQLKLNLQKQKMVSRLMCADKFSNRPSKFQNLKQILPKYFLTIFLLENSFFNANWWSLLPYQFCATSSAISLLPLYDFFQ